MNKQVDVYVRNEGTIFTFNPRTDAAKEWIALNVAEDAQWLGNQLIVEHRYARDLAAGMQEEGLVLA